MHTWQLQRCFLWLLQYAILIDAAEIGPRMEYDRNVIGLPLGTYTNLAFIGEVIILKSC